MSAGAGRWASAWRRRLVMMPVVILAATAVVIPGSSARADDQSSSELELVERYAPVLMIKEQVAPCDTDGEPFEPAPVEIVLDNREILLRQVGNGDPVMMNGPSSSDLFDLREGWYLDFPGDALDPGCVFEQDFRRFYDGESVTYAHIATEQDRPGYLALQYWFFWYHNPAKNDHEGDWEFVQVLFEADSVEDALATEPVAIGFAQHTGGERADWDDERIEVIGTRPVVYAAKGSHASYFESGHFLGRSSSEGFGCDDTTGPSRRLDPTVVLLPEQVSDPNDPFAWLSFQGRWGQREPSFFNGPTGPFAKTRWTEPVTWHDGLRTSSVLIPGGDRFGDDVIGTFCTSVEVGSTVLNRTLRSPLATALVSSLLVVAAVVLARSTRWSPVTVRPLRADRAVGQLLRASGRLWLCSPRPMLAVGLVSFPVAVVAVVVQAVVFALPFVDDLVGLAGDRSGVAFLLAVAIGGFADLLTFVYVVAAVTKLVEREPSDIRSVFPTGDEVRRLLGVVVRGGAVVIGLALTVVGVPWAIRQLVRYQFAPQMVVGEGLDARAALRHSSDLVRRRWWWTAGVALGVELVVSVVGFGAAVAVLLAVRTLPLWGFNLVSSLIYVVLVPAGAAAVVYAYGTSEARGRSVAIDEAEATHEPASG